jgi:hypothetical protein
MMVVTRIVNLAHWQDPSNLLTLDNNRVKTLKGPQTVENDSVTPDATSLNIARHGGFPALFNVYTFKISGGLTAVQTCCQPPVCIDERNL